MKHAKMMKGLKKIAKRPGTIEVPEECGCYGKMEKDAAVAEAAMKRIRKLEKKVEELERELDEYRSYRAGE